MAPLVGLTSSNKLRSPLLGGPLGGGPLGLLTNLVAYWDLNESSGDRADDSGNGFTLSDNNTVGSGTGVDTGTTAADFVTANDEYLTTADPTTASLAPRTGDYTICIWVNADTSAEMIFGISDSDVTTGGFLMIYTAAGSNVRVRCEDSASVNATSLTNGGGLGDSTGVWRFVMVRVDRTADTYSVYVDDVQQSFFTYGTTRDISALDDITVVTSDAKRLTLGREYWGGLTADGRMQGLGIWSENLTAAQSAWLYNSKSAARLYSELT